MVYLTGPSEYAAYGTRAVSSDTLGGCITAVGFPSIGLRLSLYMYPRYSWDCHGLCCGTLMG